MKKNQKRILIILGIIVGVSGLTTVSVQTTNRVIENRKVKKMEEAKKERQRIALWCVQNLKGPKIKEIKVGKLTKYIFDGTGGASIDVEINNKKQNTIVLDLDGLEKNSNPTGGGFAPKCEYTFTQKSNNNTLDGVKVKEWKGH
ncbi:hypothetical protein [Lactobacillus sp. PV034]|uniref:hypothetical protein n=1 Tax=Lactobacillus sp. PV034 TaxID=2594495 RepID=UPI00223FC31A|nr:hypothetical protein [Lactobacillus sp. PV034]QNQ80147.1 hypothetical protein FP432_00560 [Lactobacillus sp. PV034]